MDYKASLTLEAPDGTVKFLTGTLTDTMEPRYRLDFYANFSSFGNNYTMQTSADWNELFADGVAQGAQIYCLEQNTDATRHDFTVMKADHSYMRVFMPKDSFGMGHRSVNIKLGKVQGPVNVSFGFRVEDAGTNLFVNGGGKWGPAIQYGPIQSGPTGGIRFMPTWAGGASTLGKQDLTCSIQNQPNGGQWLQPPYYGYRPIEVGHWYNIRLRMQGAPADTGGESSLSTVQCQYWKDDDPVMTYNATTTNYNAQQGIADVMIDWTCFFGGTEANRAPADAYFDYRDLRVWVEA